MRKASILLSLVFILFQPDSFAQKLSAKEKKIVKIIEKNHAESMKFLEKVVNINSGTMNHEGVKEVGMIFKEAFDKIGFSTKWIEMPARVERGGHLFAEHKGSKGKRLILIGHLDTVFEKDSPFQKYEIKGEIVHGPGVIDMKGGDVIILYALKALHEAGLLDETQIIAALHGDEEKTGKPLDISRKDLIDAAKRSDIALGFEPSSGMEYTTIARRGSSGWKVEVTGKRGHSSRIFNEEFGAGAIFEMARILNQFYEELKGEEYLTFNPGIILGGTFVDFNEALSKAEVFGKSNVVSQTAVVTGGLRFISEEQKLRTREKMKEIVSKNLPQTSAKISFTDSYPSMGPTEGNKKLLKMISQVSVDLGQGEVKPFDPGKKGAADISFIAKYIDGLDGLGTMGGGAHSPDEYLDIKTVEALTKRAAILIYRLTR